MAATTKPPAHLSRSSKVLFRKVIAGWPELGHEPHALAVLVLGCESIDRGATARRELERDGLTVPTAHGVKTHPSVATEVSSRLAAVRCFRELNLSGDLAATSHGYDG
ncbi:MAG: hypothetical protein ABSG95_03215 [Solirubrobacteraceae bacterium]|jgi:hypothetical protein